MSYAEYFLNSESSVIQLELLEISHPSFTQTFYLARNAVNGVTVTLETAASQFFRYCPMKISPLGQSDNLDQAIKVQLGDLGEELPPELDALAVANDYLTKPVVKYRAYRSDDLTVPLVGPWNLEISSFTFKDEGASFEAKAPSLNINRTGELYKIERFPMLRGFL